VDCRRAFNNLDFVKYQLTVGACSLAMRALQIVKGKHTRKTAAFVRACIAFCFITIPSMEDHIGRLRLYILAGSVAMQNQAVSQADGLFKSAIKHVQEVPPRIETDGQSKSTDLPLCEILHDFISLMILVPGHPEQGPFYLIKGLLKIIAEYPWEKSSQSKAKLYMAVLSMFSSFGQPKLPYHINGVDCNDVLYGGDLNYANELQSVINKVLDELLEELAKLAQPDSEVSPQAQGKLALDLFNHLLSYSVLNAKSATLAVNLYSLAKKNLDGSSPYLANSLASVRTKEGNLAGELYKKLLSV